MDELQSTAKTKGETVGAPERESRVNDRYGDAGRAGWSPIPDVLIFDQHKLELSSEDLNVLLNLMAHYYTQGEMPFVRPNVIAKRMGVSMRSVQRSIKRLRAKGLICRAKHPTGHIAHDLTPLIERLQPFGRARIADRAAARRASDVAQLERASETLEVEGLTTNRRDAGSTPAVATKLAERKKA